MSLSSMLDSTASGIAARAAGGGIAVQAAAGPQPATTAINSLEQVTRYIPTEVVTFYVALIGAMHQAHASRCAQWIAFGITLALIPVGIWCILAAKLRAKGNPLPLSPKRWPWWKIIAALVAFTVWAYALPAGPFAGYSCYNAAYGSVALLGTTALLGWLGAVFDPIVP
jgi:hypothetical protein